MLILVVVLILLAGIYIFMQQPMFGRRATGDRLARIEQSAQYANGQFQNQHLTPSLTDGATVWGVMHQFFFGKDKRNKPSNSLPSAKTDLFQLDPNRDILVWFGHSSYFMQLSGRKILVDPVLSGYASPLPFTTRSFKGSDRYTAEDIPAVDYLFITHDHWDHMDHQTLVKIRNKTGKVITGLGVGAHLERWGYKKENIIEKDWHEQVILEPGFEVITAPSRHFSGRGFRRNTSLWSSFVLITPTLKIYIGGDSGYDTHFKQIGDLFGPFDLVVLENGQYNKSWKYIHMMPEEVVTAAFDLKAKRLFPVHWSKFSLAIHAWDDSIIRLVKEAKQQGMPMLHPMIGEAVRLDNPIETTAWWDVVP